MRPIIKVENLSKKYILGGPSASYSTLRETLVDLARKPLRSFRGNGTPSFWALKDLNFEVAPGEVVGIIGRNGAGKSTLLKVLSRITQPTSGRIELFGRVASLLEVGTGFHPELSGRENIYLNGSILGMSQSEIESKFDEIVAFAEVEKFLDTPVKRYSSGMYVRLAFAVAAHLEPEILVVDEVLAVGDYNFQQKCLNKMQDVSSRGRTILFVSHNMGAISRLCQRCLLLDGGQLVQAGNVSEVVEAYIVGGAGSNPEYIQPAAPDKDINLRRVALIDSDAVVQQEIGYDDTSRFVIEYEVNKPVKGVSVGLAFFTVDGTCAFVSSDLDTQPQLAVERTPGLYQATIEIPPRWLNIGRYSVMATIAGAAQSGEVYDNLEVLTFNIVDTGSPGSRFGVERKGVLQPILNWTTMALNK
jgi:lipopolysaccharide transport system ATP-binding protein